MSIGPTEIIIVLIIALLVFGPKRLPQMGKSLGRGVREFKKAADTAKTELGLGEVTDSINEVKSTITEPLKEVTSTFTDPIDEVKGTFTELKKSVGADEIAAGVGSAKAVLSLDPRKAARGLVMGGRTTPSAAPEADAAPDAAALAPAPEPDVAPAATAAES